MKFLIWLAIGFLIVAWLMRSKKARQSEDRRKHDGAGPASAAQVEVMLPCGHCGVFFPSSEAVTDPAGLVFCSAQHQRLHGDAHDRGQPR